MNCLPLSLKYLEMPICCYDDCENLPITLETLVINIDCNFEYKFVKKLKLPSSLGLLILCIDGYNRSNINNKYSTVIKSLFNDSLSCKYLYLKPYKFYFIIMGIYQFMNIEMIYWK